MHLIDTIRRPGENRHSEGDPQNPANPGGRPVADIIDTVGKILLFYVGFGEEAGVVVVHRDNKESRNCAYTKGVNWDERSHFLRI